MNLSITCRNLSFMYYRVVIEFFWHSVGLKSITPRHNHLQKEYLVMQKMLVNHLCAMYQYCICEVRNVGADPEVRHVNTEESVLYSIREYHNDFTLLQ